MQGASKPLAAPQSHARGVLAGLQVRAYVARVGLGEYCLSGLVRIGDGCHAVSLL